MRREQQMCGRFTHEFFVFGMISFKQKDAIRNTNLITFIATILSRY